MTKEERRKYYRQWYGENGRNRADDYCLKEVQYRKEHRLEVNVRQRFNNHINSDIIERPKHCSICGGGGRINAHHLDYDKPFEVIWCCSSCHKRIHCGEDLNEQDYRVCYIMMHAGAKGAPTIFSIC